VVAPTVVAEGGQRIGVMVGIGVVIGIGRASFCTAGHVAAMRIAGPGRPGAAAKMRQPEGARMRWGRYLLP